MVTSDNTPISTRRSNGRNGNIVITRATNHNGITANQIHGIIATRGWRRFNVLQLMIFVVSNRKGELIRTANIGGTRSKLNSTIIG